MRGRVKDIRRYLLHYSFVPVALCIVLNSPQILLAFPASITERQKVFKLSFHVERTWLEI